MKRPVLILILISLCAHPLYSWDQKKATEKIQAARQKMSDLEYNFELKKYIPHDDYAEAVISLRKASLAIERKDYLHAYYHSSMSIVKTETTTISALARKANYEQLALEKDYYKKHQAPSKKAIDLSDIIAANLLKKADTYHRVLPDKNIFIKRKYRLSKRGKETMNKIAAVLKNHESAKIKIVGHSKYRDLKAYTRRKADYLKMYLAEEGIKPERIETIGLGNSEVMDTAIGFRRVNRVEIIITGIR